MIDLSLRSQLFRVYCYCIDLDHILALVIVALGGYILLANTMPAVCLHMTAWNDWISKGFVLYLKSDLLVACTRQINIKWCFQICLAIFTHSVVLYSIILYLLYSAADEMEFSAFTIVLALLMLAMVEDSFQQPGQLQWVSILIRLYQFKSCIRMLMKVLIWNYIYICIAIILLYLWTTYLCV